MANDNNFALIVVGIVAIVAVVGMLNLGGITGKATGPVKLNSGEYVWCDANVCKDANDGVACRQLPAGTEAPCGYNMATSDGTTYSVYYKP